MYYDVEESEIYLLNIKQFRLVSLQRKPREGFLLTPPPLVPR